MNLKKLVAYGVLSMSLFVPAKKVGAHRGEELVTEQVQTGRDLESIAKSVYCLRTRATYVNSKDKDDVLVRNSHSTMLAYAKNNGYTYFISTKHSAREKNNVLLAKTKKTVKVYKLKSLEALVVDSVYDNESSDDKKVEVMYCDKTADYCILRSKDDFEVSRRYLPLDGELITGEKVWSVGYPQGMVKLISVGNVSGFGARVKDSQYIVVDVNVELGSSGSPLFVRRNGTFYLAGMVARILRSSVSGSVLATLGVPTQQFEKKMVEVAKGDKE